MQRIVVIPYRRFGTTYRSHVQKSRGINTIRCVLTQKSANFVTVLVYCVLRTGSLYRIRATYVIPCLTSSRVTENCLTLKMKAVWFFKYTSRHGVTIPQDMSLGDLYISETYDTNEIATQIVFLSCKVKAVYLLPQAGNIPNLKCGICVLISLLIN